MKILLKIFAMLLIAAMASFFIACSEDEDPVQQKVTRTVNGTWQGTIETGGTINLTLAQTGNSVTGTGFIAAPAVGFNEACTVPTGTCDGTTVSLSIKVEPFLPFTFQGSFTADNIFKGNLNGSGFTGEAITFVK